MIQTKNVKGNGEVTCGKQKWRTNIYVAKVEKLFVSSKSGELYQWKQIIIIHNYFLNINNQFNYDAMVKKYENSNELSLTPDKRQYLKLMLTLL